LGELERAFKDTGSVEDEAAWLRERVRRGELDEHQISIAAYFGYPAAELVAARIGAGRSDLEPPADLTEAGKQAWLRFNQCPAKVVLRPMERLRVMIADARGRIEGSYPRTISTGSKEIAAEFFREAGRAALAGEPWRADDARLQYLLRSQPRGLRALEALNALIRLGKGAEPETHSMERQAQLREVVPWLLGYGDPLRELLEEG